MLIFMHRTKRLLTFENDRGVGSNQHSTGSSTTSRPGRTLSVDGNVTGEDDGVSSIPGRRLDPVDGVENGGSGAIAGVLAVNTLDIVIARLRKKVHKGSLDGFRLVDDGLGADF